MRYLVSTFFPFLSLAFSTANFCFVKPHCFTRPFVINKKKPVRLTFLALLVLNTFIKSLVWLPLLLLRLVRTSSWFIYCSLLLIYFSFNLCPLKDIKVMFDVRNSVCFSFFGVSFFWRKYAAKGRVVCVISLVLLAY